ncbi:MAG: hypothetical protein M1820_007063 [Bogoriella megaspora]|nr:MAG: hypothetical protein M1820_007063 [Bogoriella megaspora]
MKLVITGATGWVGTEVVRQALRNPAVTSIVALGRNPTSIPKNSGPNASKLQSVILDDWTSPYPEAVQTAIAGADGCIWCLAVAPSESKEMPFEDVTRVCSEYTLHALSSIAATANVPFRFIYASGVFVERDQSKTNLPFLEDYMLMRGRVENAILAFAHENAPKVQAAVTKPGAIDSPDRPAAGFPNVPGPLRSLFRSTPPPHGTGRVHLSELAATMIDQCVNGVTKDPLWGEDCARIGKQVLKAEDYLP